MTLITPTTPTTLLPPNATQFQRDLERVNGLTAGTLEAVDKIKTIKSDPPKDVLYWLIWEYGLGDLLEYIDDLKLLINEGLKWQRFRGTPDSLELALGWIGIHDLEIEEEVPGVHFYQFQLKLGEIPDRARVDNIINLSRLSAPVRSRLSRLYNTEYDKRRLIPSDPDGKGQFGFLLSDYSGVHYEDIVLSFGRKDGAAVTAPPRQVKNAHFRAVKIKLNPLDYPVLGDMLISDAPIPNRTSAIHRLSTIGFVHPGNDPFSLAGLDWFGTWGRRTWEDAGFISLGMRQFRYHCFKQEFPDFTTGKRRYTYHTFRVPIDDLVSKRAQTRTHTIGEPDSSAGLDWFGTTWGPRTWETPGVIDFGAGQLRYHCFKEDIPGLIGTGQRRYTYHIYPVTIDDPGLTRTQIRTHTLEDSIPGGSAGAHRYTSRSIRAEYTGTASGSRLAREFTDGAVYTEDADNPPRIARTRQFSTIQLRQENGMPLFSAGSDWFGQWDERTWASPLFTNIGVIHGNTN